MSKSTKNIVDSVMESVEEKMDEMFLAFKNEDAFHQFKSVMEFHFEDELNKTIKAVLEDVELEEKDEIIVKFNRRRR